MPDTGTTPTAPEGWFADPYVSGQVRWWSGSTWTGHTRPAEQANERTPSGSHSSDASPPVSTSRRWRPKSHLVWGAVIAFGIVIGVVGAQEQLHPVQTFHRLWSTLMP